jgi:hypothetical protein
MKSTGYGKKPKEVRWFGGSIVRPWEYGENGFIRLLNRQSMKIRSPEKSTFERIFKNYRFLMNYPFINIPLFNEIYMALL